jgi:HAD superfamily hydrolase (TIGR01509 family)
MRRAYLFDLDGVLVRSEEIHHLAYQQLCAAHGERLDWSFERYCLGAHYGPERLQLELRGAVPGLFEKQPSWEALYREKSRLYLELLDREEVPMQPGAAAILERLRAAGAPHAIVTNSTREQTASLRRRHSALDRVPLWITREAYADPKPAPDAYLEATRHLDRRPEECLGFEDTPRGLQALVAAGVPAVLVTTVRYPNLGVAESPLRIDNLAELPLHFLP